MIALIGAVSSVHALSPAQLDTVVDRYNTQTPRMVAKNVREERLRRDGNTLVYTYRHLIRTREQFRRENFEQRQRASVIPAVCADPATSRTLREGVSFRYVYLDADGTLIGTLDISARDCR